MLIATPDTTWSTPNVIVATACTRAPTAPKKIAASNPTHGPCWLPMYPPAQAPIIIMPSSPIFTTPARSANKPPSAAKTIGIESKSAACAVPTLVRSDAPVVIRIIERIAIIPKKITIVRRIPESLPFCNIICHLLSQANDSAK